MLKKKKEIGKNKSPPRKCQDGKIKWNCSEQQPQKSQPSILLLSLLDRVNKEKVNKKGKDENIEPFCYVGKKGKTSSMPIVEKCR